MYIYALTHAYSMIRLFALLHPASSTGGWCSRVCVPTC